MTTISVIVPTNRIGGIDVLLSGLAVQSMPREDFELVLVDNLHARREKLVTEAAEGYGVRVQHLPPLNVERHPDTSNIAQNGRYQRALNTGLVHAKGRLVMILCDYTYLHPDCLQLHASFHDDGQRSGSHSLGGEVWCGDVRPLIHPDLPLRYGWYAMGHNPALYKDATFVPSYRPWLDSGTRLELIEKWSGDYMRDLQSGALDAFLYSTFGQNITPSTDLSGLRIWQKDKSETPAGQVHHQLCNLKQNSFAIDDLLGVGGMNEDMDGCHGHQDSELAGRLEAQRGTRFWLAHGARCTLFDPHGIAIVRDMQSGEEKNLGIYNAGHENGFRVPIVGSDLLKLREVPR